MPRRKPEAKACRRGRGRLIASPVSPDPNASSRDKFPPQIKYIVGNEACERFSFYGMISILQLYIANRLGTGSDQATEIQHLFKSANYFMPLVGAWIADRYLGRYRSILYLSLFYCAGHAMMAVGEGTFWGLYAGLGLIALGSGGIKPSVSAFVGDQFLPHQSHLLRKVYGWFYWSINFGSFFSFLLIPWIRDRDPATTWVHGYSWAFGVPGIFMGLATLIFWLGTPRFERIPPAGDPPGQFFKASAISLLLLALLVGVGWGCSYANLASGMTAAVYATVILAGAIPATRALQRRMESGAPDKSVGPFSVAWYLITRRLNPRGTHFYAAGRPHLSQTSINDAAAFLRVLKVLALIPFFWALWDQTSSTWVTQGTLMQEWIVPFGDGKFAIGAEQMQSMNALIVMVLVPLFTLGIYPSLDRLGWKATPVRRMSVGLFLTAFSFVLVGLIQQRIDSLAGAGQKMSVLWQTVPYIVLTAGEVLVSATGNEFAYTHAPKTMKSTMTSLWLLTISVGNLLVALFTWLAHSFGGSGVADAGAQAASAAQFYRYAVLTFIVSLVFLFVASRFRARNYSEDGQDEGFEPLTP